MTYSDDLAEFIRAWEGLKLTPSPDRLRPDVIDVGYGHRVLPDERRREITRAEADELLDWDLQRRCAVLETLIAVPLTQCRFDALLAFAYNVGTGAKGLGGSTLLKLVNADDFDAAAEEFGKWVNAAGAPVDGLVKRRRAERAMFERGDYSGRP